MADREQQEAHQREPAGKAEREGYAGGVERLDQPDRKQPEGERRGARAQRSGPRQGCPGDQLAHVRLMIDAWAIGVKGPAADGTDRAPRRAA